MQGIYKNFNLYTHDITWTCLLDIVQQKNGNSEVEHIFNILDDNKGELWIASEESAHVLKGRELSW